MKNRKNVLIVFAVLAILCLGIGYAALVDELNLSGTVEASSSDSEIIDETVFDVDWGTVTPTIVKAGNEANIDIDARVTSEPNDTALLEVSGLSVAGDKVKVVYEIVNNSQVYNASLKLDDTGSVLDTDEHLTVSYFLANSATATEGGKTLELLKGAKVYLICEITLNTTFESTELSSDVTLKLKVTATTTNAL